MGCARTAHDRRLDKSRVDELVAVPTGRERNPRTLPISRDAADKLMQVLSAFIAPVCGKYGNLALVSVFAR